MRRRFIIQFSVWLAVASSSAAMLLPAGLVLCVSEAGHVEIETGDDDCCQQEGTADRELAHSDRCACVDTPLLRDAARSHSGAERLLSAWVATSHGSLVPFPVHESTCPVASEIHLAQHAREPMTLARLRSVVLLA